jgi:hypothetical protein
MSILIRDESTLTALTIASEAQDVHGPDGRLLGRFIPVPKAKMTYPELGMTDEELEERLNDPNATWHTPEEVMARLREIDQCSP